MSGEAAPAPAAILRGRALSGGYVPGVDIIHDVDFDVHPREIVTIIGPNGAGKSTLVKALVGALPHMRGRRWLGDEEVSGLDRPRMVAAGAAFVPQTENIFGALTVRENLEMGGYRRTSRSGLNDRIGEMFELFPPLRERPKERADRLSGGQRQMLAIARALMLDPKVLCLDEPTASLSPAARAEIFERVRGIRDGGVGVLMVEQNATEALESSDRGVVMVNGRRALDGPASELLESDEVGRLFLGVIGAEGGAVIEEDDEPDAG